MRPTDYFESWSEVDRGLARGLLAHEGSMTRNGVDAEKAVDPEYEGWWLTDVKSVDYAAKALDEAMEKLPAEDRKYVTPRVWLDPDYTPTRKPKRGGGKRAQ